MTFSIINALITWHKLMIPSKLSFYCAPFLPGINSLPTITGARERQRPAPARSPQFTEPALPPLCSQPDS